MLLDLGGAHALAPLLQTETVEGDARFSPDGRWLAYDAGLQTPEVYLRAFPGPGLTVQVSSGGGRAPVWAANGRELFYWTSSGIMAVSLSPGREIAAGGPRLLVRGDFAEEYDVSPDGRRFLVMKAQRGTAGVQLQIVTGWLDHVRTKLGSHDLK